MSKEQLKLVKDIRNYIDGQGEYDEEVEALDWLIKEAEPTQYFAEKNTELNEFLDDYATAKDWGKNVIDVAMRIIKDQDEQVDGLKNKAKKLKEEKQKFMLSATKQRKQKQHYRNLLESIRYTPEIAKEIHKENPDKKVIDANDLLQHVLRKINAELERESE